MKSMKTIGMGLALGAVTVLLNGCATLGSTYTPDASAPKDKATVYVYRTSGFGGAAISYTVSVNGTEISSLPSGGYFVYYAAPGENEFTAKTEAKTSVTVDAKAGETYFVKGTIGMGVLVGHPHLTAVANDVGTKEIATCKLVPPKVVAKN
jgi:Protein of unknown function (DUF2846)